MSDEAALVSSVRSSSPLDASQTSGPSPDSMSTCAPSGLQDGREAGAAGGRHREQLPAGARIPDACSVRRHRKESGAIRAPRDRIRPEAARRMPAEHPELTTGGGVEDANGGVLARRCDSRAVRAEDRAVDAAEARRRQWRPRMTTSCRPVSASKIRALPSAPAVAMREPSGLTSTPITARTGASVRAC